MDITAITKDLQDSLNYHRGALSRYNKLQAWVDANVEKLEQLSEDTNVGVYSSSLQFYTDDRDEVMRIIQLFPGTWDKHTDDVMIYMLKVSDDVTLHIHTKALPPSCRLEEYEEQVPARTIKRKRVVCDQDPNAVTA